MGFKQLEFCVNAWDGREGGREWRLGDFDDRCADDVLDTGTRPGVLS